MGALLLSFALAETQRAEMSQFHAPQFFFIFQWTFAYSSVLFGTRSHNTFCEEMREQVQLICSLDPFQFCDHLIVKWRVTFPEPICSLAFCSFVKFIRPVPPNKKMKKNRMQHIPAVTEMLKGQFPGVEPMWMAVTPHFHRMRPSVLICAVSTWCIRTCRVQRGRWKPSKLGVRGN